MIDGEMRKLTSALIVEDHPLFCDALSMTLRAVAGIETIETADRLEAALTRLDLSPVPDVIVLDLNLPDVNGLDGLIRLRATVGDVPVVVVSSLADNRVIGAALRAGAVGFVPKHARREVFKAAFDAIRAGEGYVPDGFVPQADPQRPGQPAGRGDCAAVAVDAAAGEDPAIDLRGDAEQADRL